MHLLLTSRYAQLLKYAMIVAYEEREPIGIAKKKQQYFDMCEYRYTCIFEIGYIGGFHRNIFAACLPYHCVSFLFQWILLSYKRKDDDEGASLSLTICGMKNLTRVILVSGYFRVAPTWSKRRNARCARYECARSLQRLGVAFRGVRFRFADGTNTGWNASNEARKEAT